MASLRRQNVVFFHPDLGIGGAERLVIDAAVGLQGNGHKVTIFTSHCDPSHCFDEARNGTLDVRVRGNTIVPPTILGRFSILCAILRQVHLILQIALLSIELQALQPTVFFVDQLSAGVPILRTLIPRARILFYCHFPDKLLAKQGSLLKTLYRVPFDRLESWSTGCSDGIVVNSKFTRGIFNDAFPYLQGRKPSVVYPCVHTESVTDADSLSSEAYWAGESIVLSINRFERKKDIGLAIRAFARLPAALQRTTRLILAGGYDVRVAENVAYHAELSKLADDLQLKHATCKSIVSALAIPTEVRLIFLLSVPNGVKARLLASARLLLYTPRNEHLGIVPLEAMLARTPVLAADEGGPTETVVEGRTGWLRDVADVDAWTAVMARVLDGSLDEVALRRIGEQGRARVRELFSREQLAGSLEAEMVRIAQGPRPPLLDTSFVLALFVSVAVVVGASLLTWQYRSQ